ncbi:hypothetical protein Tco_0724514, partial [Tanacetum coccineum]
GTVVPIELIMKAFDSPIPLAPDELDLSIPIVVAATVNNNMQLPSFRNTYLKRRFSIY